MEPRQPRGDEGFNQANIDKLLPATARPISIGTLGDAYGLSKDLASLSCVVGKTSGSAVSMADFQNSIYLRHRWWRSGSWAVGTQSNPNDGSFISEAGGTGDGGAKFIMGKRLYTYLKSHGFTQLQDMGVDGRTPGATRSIEPDIAYSQGDYIYKNFMMRDGYSYFRAYK